MEWKERRIFEMKPEHRMMLVERIARLEAMKDVYDEESKLLEFQLDVMNIPQTDRDVLRNEARVMIEEDC